MNIIFALHFTYIHSIEGKNAHYMIPPPKKNDDGHGEGDDTWH